jgi:arginyl-tRNA synthetase
MEEVQKRRPELSPERMREIAEQVGKGAIKFNILKVDPHKSMEFRWEEAIDFTGDSSAYVQYACARCAGILGNAGRPKVDDLSSLTSPEERELAWALARIPSVIRRSSEEMKPNYIAEHAIEVATLFNKFYMQHRVLQAEEPTRSARLALVKSVQVSLSLLLDLLGVASPEEI